MPFTENKIVPIKRALISVSDKNNLVELAQSLQALSIEIVSTGGTSKLLTQHKITHTEISDYTGFPEIMDGRVKTLHPKIHGGLLARRGLDDAVMQKHDILPIDLVIVNLYPFKASIEKSDASLENAIENIDIGGPTMLRAAAKNYSSVTVITDHLDYAELIQSLNAHGGLSLDQRFKFAVKTYEHTASYDAMIANALGSYRLNQDFHGFSSTFNAQFQLKQTLQYGENPHQTAAFYQEAHPESGCMGNYTQLAGKKLSYNNIADADAALECVKQFKEPACVIVKHANPCGVAIASHLHDAYQRAYQTDSTSAFGGIIAFNQTLDCQTVSAIIKQQFVEIIIAPAIDDGVIDIIAQKPNVRLLTCGALPKKHPENTALDFKKIRGGLLVQTLDQKQVCNDELKVVSQRIPTEQELTDLAFAWKVAKFVKSNAIVYCQGQTTIGIGAGQMNRVDSARIAIMKAESAGLSVKHAVMASDAFFPFKDSIEAAAKAGITAVIQPGGSIRDQEVIDEANKHKIAMIFTNTRHFKH